MWLDELRSTSAARSRSFTSTCWFTPNVGPFDQAGSYRRYVAEGLMRLKGGEQFDSFSSHVRSGIRVFNQWTER